MEGTTYPEHLALEVSLDSRLTEGASCLEPLEQSVRNSSLAVWPIEGVTENVLDWKPVINPAISYTLDGRPMEGTTYLEHLALEVSLDSRLTEGASCLEPLEQLVFSSSLAARPVEGVAVKVLEGKPVIHPVQDSTPDGQPMEGTTYLEHPALGVSLDSRLREGMSHTDTLEQSVLGEGSIVRPEAADMSERHHKQTCVKLSARPMPDIDIVHNTDVSTDINTDRPENSAPRNIWDVNLFKCNTQDTQGGRPMEGMTKSRQEELSGFELAIAGTDKEQLPTSYSLEQSESIISESQNYLKNTEESNSATILDFLVENWKMLSDARCCGTG